MGKIVRLVCDSLEFTLMVGKISDVLAFADLSIQPCTRLGWFMPHRLPELLDFCHANPAFHIVSSRGFGVLQNKAVVNAESFNLAIGDASEDLWFLPWLDLSRKRAAS